MTPADHAATVRQVMAQGERAMSELNWTVANVNWRVSLDALVALAERATELEREPLFTLREMQQVREAGRQAEVRAERLETALQDAAKALSIAGKVIEDARDGFAPTEFALEATRNAHYAARAALGETAP